MDYAYLEDNYRSVWKNISSICDKTGRDVKEISLVAVSKTFPAEIISCVNNLGHIDFGENKVQELVQKRESLQDKNIRWHLVGHLQTNKVKQILEFVHLIHSVDTIKLANEINEQAKKKEKKIPVLIQVNTSDELQKSGTEVNFAKDLCYEVLKMNNLELKGLMTIGMFTDDEPIIRDNFRVLKNLYDELKPDINTFEHLSMGMTSDYDIAIEEGATMLRIGSAIFGNRNYKI
jgi:PLP dependent protein